MSESGRGSPSSGSAASDKEASVECDCCGDLFESHQSLGYHLKTSDCTGVQCPTCGDDHFISSRGMKIHHKQSHGKSLNERQATCEQCGGEFTYNKSQRTHPRFCCRGCKDEWQKCLTGEDSPSWNGGNAEVECEYCGDSYEVFPAKKEDSRFCSIECKAGYQREEWSKEDHPSWRGGPVTVKCEYCSSEYKEKPARVHRTSFCSSECHDRYRSENGTMAGENHPRWSKIEVECEWCEKTLLRSPSEIFSHIFCNAECFGEWQSVNKTGENSHRWRGGGVRYYGNNWQRQRRLCLERDNRTCQDCGSTNNLHVHHIMPIRKFDIPEDANGLDNLITLCQDCHLGKWEGIPLRPQYAD